MDGVSATPSLMLKAVAATKSMTSASSCVIWNRMYETDLVVHPTSELDGMNERPEVVVGEDHPGGLLGDLAAAAHGHADVRLLQRGRVVDRVAGHGDDQALFLHQASEAQLVLRRDPPEHVQLGAVGPSARRPRGPAARDR